MKESGASIGKFKRPAHGTQSAKTKQVTKYDVRVNGQVRWKISEEEISDLYSRGFVTRDTPCKVTGVNDWKEVNEFFQTLKYRPVGAPIRIQVPGASDHEFGAGKNRQRMPGMKPIIWFVSGILVGIFALLAIQKIQNSKASSPELRIAASYEKSPWLTPAPSATPILTAKQPSRATAPDQFFDSQWTSRVTVTTPRPRIFQPTQSFAQNPPAMQVSTAPAKPKGQEVSIFLGRKQQIKTRSGTYQIFLHDHGSETISVSVEHGPYTRVKKVLGTDTVGDNRTLIYSDGNVQFFYINTPRAPQNCCLIEIVPMT